MISLVQLLNEVEGKPKAIILAGAPGAGKGYILKGLDLGGLKVLNIDIFKTVKRLFDLEFPRHKPVFTEFKTTAKREL